MIIVNSVLIIYLFLLLIFKPYDYDSANSLEILSTFCGVSNILCIYACSISEDGAITIYMTLFALIPNFVFLLLIAKYFLVYQIEYIISGYVKLKTEIYARFPKLRILFKKKEQNVLRS